MLDLSLYLVTDRELALGRDTINIVATAVRGGITCVQLREKHCSTREFIEEARAIKKLLAQMEYPLPLIINDRLDVALAVGADGVHLGQSDMRLADARRLVGKTMVIGISAESVADALEAERAGADYVGISPVFSTPTKTDTAPPLGLTGIRAIRAAVSLPLVGIGGIHRENAAEVLQAGADGVAVVSAIVSAACPRSAAAALKQQINAVKNDHSVSS
ncbi:MAG: thiamine phosphate synthase [Desulfobulbus sp.]|nr:thiamine phosphate synthase [Desulfobulbus sp.]